MRVGAGEDGGALCLFDTLGIFVILLLCIGLGFFQLLTKNREQANRSGGSRKELAGGTAGDGTPAGFQHGGILLGTLNICFDLGNLGVPTVLNHVPLEGQFSNNLLSFGILGDCFRCLCLLGVDLLQAGMLGPDGISVAENRVVPVDFSFTFCDMTAEFIGIGLSLGGGPAVLVVAIIGTGMQIQLNTDNGKLLGG